MRKLLAITLSLIFALGCVMIYGTTSAEVLDHSLSEDLHSGFFKQIFCGILGLGVAWAISRYDYRRLLTITPAILSLLVILLILCFVPGIGRQVNGSYRWVSLWGMTFQPSEVVKIVAPLFFVQQVVVRYEGRVTFYSFLKALILPLIAMGLILAAPSHSTFGLLGIVFLALCFICRIPLQYWLIPVTVGGFFLGVVAWNVPYVRGRLEVFIHPEKDLHGRGHQPYQARIAAGSGQLFGRGIGRSLQKMSYLPEAHNDYIAAIYAEEFGFIGMIVLLVLYMVFVFAGVSIAFHAEHPLGVVTAASLVFLIAFQAFINLGVVSGLLPSTGLNLPFFSQGGTSLLVNFLCLGILMNISKQSEKQWISVAVQ